MTTNTNYVQELMKIRIRTGSPDSHGKVVNANIMIGMESPVPTKDFTHGTTAEIRVEDYGTTPKVTLTQPGVGFLPIDFQKKRLMVFQEAVRIAEMLHYSQNPIALVQRRAQIEDGYSFGIRRVHA